MSRAVQLPAWSRRGVRSVVSVAATAVTLLLPDSDPLAFAKLDPVGNAETGADEASVADAESEYVGECVPDSGAGATATLTSASRKPTRSTPMVR
jgi:hypothetical protein